MADESLRIDTENESLRIAKETLTGASAFVAKLEKAYETCEEKYKKWDDLVEANLNNKELLTQYKEERDNANDHLKDIHVRLKEARADRNKAREDLNELLKPLERLTQELEPIIQLYDPESSILKMEVANAQQDVRVAKEHVTDANQCGKDDCSACSAAEKSILPVRQVSRRGFSALNAKIKSLYSLAEKLSVTLPDEYCDEFKNLDHWMVEEKLIVAFFKGLKTNNIKCLILDEAQKNLDLVEFLVKSPGISPQGFCRLIISGTPACRTDSIDYGGSVSARVSSVVLSTLRGYEVYSFLRCFLNDTISSTCWLDFWTIFNGEPWLYKQMATQLNEMDPEKKTMISILGIDNDSLSILDKCTTLVRTMKIVNYGVDELLYTIGVQKKRQSVCTDKGQSFIRQQKMIDELLEKDNLVSMPTVEEFVNSHKKHGKVLACRDPFIKNQMRYRDGIDARNFSKARGFGLEDLAAELVDWHIQSKTDLEKILGFPFSNCEILWLDYEGNTDADLLLVEKTSESNPRVLIFNIKTHPNMLLNDDTIDKFQKLCQKFHNYDVHLALFVEDLYNVDPTSIIDKWRVVQGFNLLPKIYTLKDFIHIAPTIRVTKNDMSFSVDRPLEKKHIIYLLRNVCVDVVVQGRFRVGKTHLLKEMATENNGWKYLELP